MRSVRHTFELLLVLLVFCIFAVGSLFLSAAGANSYKETAAIMQTNYDLRTGVLYLTEKTRQNDVAGSISVRQFNGSDALVLTEQVTGRGFETWIFVYDGMLCEQMIASGAQIELSAIQNIMPMKSMILSLDTTTQMLRIDLETVEGDTSSTTLVLKSQGSPFSVVFGAQFFGLGALMGNLLGGAR